MNNNLNQKQRRYIMKTIFFFLSLFLVSSLKAQSDEIPKILQSSDNLEQVANQGHADAQYDLSQVLLNENEGNADAQYDLSQVLLNENEGDMEYAKDYWKQSRSSDNFSLEQSANQGNRFAQYEQGQVLYNEGDFEQAKYLWKQAANQGHGYAQRLLNLILPLDDEVLTEITLYELEQMIRQMLINEGAERWRDIWRRQLSPPIGK